MGASNRKDVTLMLGEKIAALRKARGMSQQTLAESLFVTRQTISKWEKNLSVPDADVLIRLADALDATVQSLLGQEEEATEAVPSDIASALMHINDQLAIQNRRRAKLWKIVAWVLGVFVAFNLLLLVLGYAVTAQFEGEVVTHEESIVITEE